MSGLPPREECLLLPPPEEGGRGVGNESCPPQSPSVTAPPWEEPRKTPLSLTAFVTSPEGRRWKNAHPEAPTGPKDLIDPRTSYGGFFTSFRMSAVERVELNFQLKKRLPFCKTEAVLFTYMTTMFLWRKSSFMSAGKLSSVMSTSMSSSRAKVCGMILPIFELSSIMYSVFAF